MFLNTGLIRPVAGTPVQLPGINFNTDGTNNPVYSGVRFDSDGKIYKTDAAGNWQYAADWLLDGAASDYYLWRTIESGTFTQDDGDGNQLNTGDLDYYLTNSVDWFFRTGSITFKISDDSAGSNILVTRLYSFSAYHEGTGSPP
jgi:hypothetical protein